MVDFTFGQVEATLAAINGIADHKRVAFAGRLKFLQKHGLPKRDRPGRGKAGTFTFGQTMQIGLGVELLKFGIPPQRAARLVGHNWSELRYSVYLGTYTQNEARDLADERGADPPHMNWLWLVRLDALADLTAGGESEYDDYEAIEAVELEGVASMLDAMAHARDANGRRTLLINGTALTRAVLHQIAFGFRFATIEAMREDILEETRELTRMLEDAGHLLSKRVDLTPGQKTELIRKLREAKEADYSTNPPTPAHVVERHAREMIARLEPSAVKLLASLHRDWDKDGAQTTISDEKSRAALINLIDFGAITLPEDWDPDVKNPPLNLEITPLGFAASRVAAEKVGGNNGDNPQA